MKTEVFEIELPSCDCTIKVPKCAKAIRVTNEGNIVFKGNKQLSKETRNYLIISNDTVVDCVGFELKYIGFYNINKTVDIFHYFGDNYVFEKIYTLKD